MDVLEHVASPVPIESPTRGENITTIFASSRLSVADRLHPYRVRILLCLSSAALLFPAVDLPDMRWLFERAQILDARSDVHRLDRVRAWAVIPLLYPEDDPRTENDDVWRLISRNALARLDASAAGHPGPRDPQPTPVVQTDPLRDRLGVVLAADPAGGVLISEVVVAGSGLQTGDRLIAMDGIAIQTPREVAQRILTSGRIDFTLNHGREIGVLAGPEYAAPRLLGLRTRGDVAVWQDIQRWSLQPTEDFWLVEGRHDSSLVLEVDGQEQTPPPGCASWSVVTGPGSCSARRRGPASGRFDLCATPLSGSWRELVFDVLRPHSRLMLGVRAGQALVVESQGDQHVLTVRGPAGQVWSDGIASGSKRIVRHGSAAGMAGQAIVHNGVAEIDVRPSRLPGRVRLRILSSHSSEARQP